MQQTAQTQAHSTPLRTHSTHTPPALGTPTTRTQLLCSSTSPTQTIHRTRLPLRSRSTAERCVQLLHIAASVVSGGEAVSRECQSNFRATHELTAAKRPPAFTSSCSVTAHSAARRPHTSCRLSALPPSLPPSLPLRGMTAAVLPSRGSSAAAASASSQPASSQSNASSASSGLSSASRPLLGFRLSCPPSSLRQSYHLLDVDSLDKSSGDSEYRRQKLPHFDCERLTLSGGFQAQATQQSVATQTAPRQYRSAICQYELQRLPPSECAALMSSAAMHSFVHAVHDALLSELDKNRALDVFKDEFALDDPDDDDDNAAAAVAAAAGGAGQSADGSSEQQRSVTAAAAAGGGSKRLAAGGGSAVSGASRPSHSLSLFHSFHHLLYSRQHSVGWVEWHPSRCLVAFSLVPTWNFDQWCDHSGEVSLSYILLYDLSQLLMPLTIVKVPGVVTVFKFHPTAHLAAAQPTAQSQQQRASSQPPATASSLFGAAATPLVAGLQTGQLILYLINTSATGSVGLGGANSAALPSKGGASGGAASKGAASKAKSGKLGDASTAQSAVHEGASTEERAAAASVDAAACPASISSTAASAAASSSSFLSSLSSTSPADGSSVLPSPLYTLLSNLDRSHGRPVTDIHWLPAPHSINRKGERTFNPSTAAAASALFSSQIMSFAADGKVLYWDYRQLNEQNAHNGGLQQYAHSQQAVTEGEGWMNGTPEEWHEKRDGKWSPLYALPLHMQSGHGGGGGDGHDEGRAGQSSTSSPSVPNSFVRTSTAFPVSSLVTARKVALGPSLASPLLVAVSEDGELLEIDTSARPGGASSSDSSSSSSSSHSHSAPSSVLRRCRAHTTVGVSIDRSAVLPSLYASCGESTFALWQVGGERPVFVSPPCHAASYSAARWSPTRPAVLCLGRTDGVVEVWDCLDATHQPAYSFPTGSTDAITALQFQPAANNQLMLTQTQTVNPAAAAATGASSSSLSSSSASHSALLPFPLPVAGSLSPVPFPAAYSSSARQYLCAGDAGGKCHIIEMPRPLRRRMAGEDAAVLRWVEREKRRGAAQQAATERKGRGLPTATPYQQLSEQMQRLFQHGAGSSGTQALAATSAEVADGTDTAGAGGSGGSGGGAAAAVAVADSSAEHEYAATVSQLLASLQAQAGKQADEASVNDSAVNGR